MSQTATAFTDPFLALEVVDGGSFAARCSSCPEWHFEGDDYEAVLEASLRHWLDAHGKPHVRTATSKTP